ncbi:RCC1 and BTB domain-containing protein 2 [Phytophthora cinnamomi]|uniref:RCC1 and BTB domain-containing protein 2 n=1 Tax=Phytophthora cinnamomi TaxID=4785 RepID=UPI00355ACAA9|nr:RCC1 and BTB domain-containing protein 2 [Phytophthora cinnamomi]
MTPATSAAAFERQDALAVSASCVRAAFGGAAAVYSLWLCEPCTSVVVVHLLLPSDAAGSVRLSSDRLRFTPDNFRQPQLVRVEALENHTQWIVISHRLFSLDRNYDRSVAPDVVVHTEATPLERPLLTFGGLMTKRKAAAMGPAHSTRLDISTALPEETSNDAAEAQGASWCVSHLASGYRFSVAAVVQPRGTTLLSWGLNTNGELGNGTMTSSPTPQMVVTFPLHFQREPLSIAHVSCGKHHVAVITGQAKLFTWGSNNQGMKTAQRNVARATRRNRVPVPERNDSP